MIAVEPLVRWDMDAADALLDAAFGTDRHGRTAYAIRRGMAWLTDLSFAAVDSDSGQMVGLLQSWPVALHAGAGAQVPLVMVGPVAVLPERQGLGIGRLLMDRLIAAADAADTAPLTMIGDADYYGRFWGFAAMGTSGWSVPGPVDPARLLVRTAPGTAPVLPATGMLGPRVAVVAHV